MLEAKVPEADVLEAPVEEVAPEEEIAPEITAEEEQTPESLEAPEPVEEPRPEVNLDEQFEGWLQQVENNPKSITSIPTREHARIFEAQRDRAQQAREDDRQAYEASAAQLYEQAREIGRVQALAEIWVRGRDDMLDEESANYDPGAYARWRKEKPEEFRAYTAFKAQQGIPATDNGLTARVNSVWQEAAKFPTVLTALKAEVDAGKYQMTPESIAAFERAAYRQIGAAEARKPGAATQQVAARAANAERTQQLPRPPSSNGIAPGARADVKDALRTGGIAGGNKAFKEKWGFDP